MKRFFKSYLGNLVIKQASLATILIGFFLLCVLPFIFGWFGDNVIGSLFAPFLAKHDTLFRLTEQALGAGYTLLVVAGFDFLFLFMAYIAVNTIFERNGTRKDIAGVAFRALQGLLLWQVIIATAFLVLFGKRSGVYVYSLIPPFLTQNGLASVYMMLWELSLLLYAFGYALMEDGIKALLAGGMLAIRNFIILFTAAGICIILTWLPGLCLSFLHVPTWILALVGITLHTLFFSVLLYVFLQQDDLIEIFANTTK